MYATSISKKLIYFPSATITRGRGTTFRSNFGKLIFWAVPVLIIIGLTSFYIFLVNNAISMSYEIKEHKKVIINLEKQKEFLGGELSQARSINNLEGVAKNVLKMENSSAASFLTILPSEVALDK